MPDFGRGMLRQWAFDPEILYLNHGTVGAPPRKVLEVQQAIRDEIERHPARFLLRELAAIAVEPPLRPRMRVAADAVARFMGARGEDLVFVDNATTGANAVLRSFPFQSGDEILATNLAYGAVVNAAVQVARESRIRVRTLNLPFPVQDPNEIKSLVADALTSKTRLVILDHITSESALVMPIADLVTLCRSHGAAVLVDGAHVPAARPLDIPAIGADWYTGNLHKWAYAPRSCGFLWARPERQEGLHPPVISWGLDQGFTTEFDWVGTRDPTPSLAAPAGIEFLRQLGEDAVQKYNHTLAWEAAQLLCESWRLSLATPEAMIGTMATVPLPPSFGTSKEDAVRLRNALLFEDRIEVAVHPIGERLWLRICAQVYNEMADYERLAQAVYKRM